MIHIGFIFRFCTLSDGKRNNNKLNVHKRRSVFPVRNSADFRHAQTKLLDLRYRIGQCVSRADVCSHREGDLMVDFVLWAYPPSWTLQEQSLHNNPIHRPKKNEGLVMGCCLHVSKSNCMPQNAVSQDDVSVHRLGSLQRRG